VTIT